MSDPANEIIEVLTVAYRLAQATDDGDPKAYSACLAPLVHDGATECDADSYARAAIDRTRTMDWTHHKLMNPVVSLDGDRASARIDVVIDMARRVNDGHRRHATIFGRYDLGLERIAGEWRIARRTLNRRYALGDSALADP